MNWQLILVQACIFLSLVFLGRSAWKTWRTGKGGCGGGCHCEKAKSTSNARSADKLLIPLSFEKLKRTE